MNSLNPSRPNPAHFLCIDTSGDECQAGVAVSNIGKISVLSRTSVRNRRTHSEKLIGLIGHVLEHAGLGKENLNAAAVSIGPGSFTGLRIGLSVAKGLALGLGIPVIPVSTHDAIAYPFRTFSLPVLVLTAAKKNEWFVTRYGDGERSQTSVLSVNQWLRMLDPRTVILCDDRETVLCNIPAELQNTVLIPGLTSPCPDIGSIGCIAAELYPDWKDRNSDELVPDYILPFLGKM